MCPTTAAQPTLANVTFTPPMTSKSMTFRLPTQLAQAIEAQAKAIGRDRTAVVAEALAQTFGLALPSKVPITVEMLQQQVEQSEHSIRLLSEQLANLQKAIRTDSSTLCRLELLEQFSHSLRALLSTTLEGAKTGLMLETVAVTRYNQEPSTLQQSEPTTLELTAQWQPKIEFPERILAMMSDPVFVCDRSHRLVYINPLGARSLKLDARKLDQSATKPCTLQDLGVTIELKAQLITQVETVFATGRSITDVISLVTPLHGLRDYEYTFSPLQGTIDYIEALLFSTRDITERKQIEAALKEAETNYQHLFESTNDSILILDACTRRILNANTNAFKRLGYTRQQLLQLTIDALVPQWSTDTISNLSQQLRMYGKSVFKHYLCHKDGTEIPVEISSGLIEYGDRLAIQSFIHDLSGAKYFDGDRD